MKSYQFRKKAVLLGCIVGLVLSGTVMGQMDKSSNPEPQKKVVSTKNLKPQTTCPVMGGDIDKSLYVDYKGKRIYVCCPNCLDLLRKNPEKYLKKLEKMGQEPEAVPTGETASPAQKDKDQGAAVDTSVNTKTPVPVKEEGASQTKK